MPLEIESVSIHHMMFRDAHSRLTVVKVQTNEPGLYGLGCATFTQRYLAVDAALREHVIPLVLGRDPRQSEDLWNQMTVSGYWRNGPVLNNAISGIDMALWDIKGKLAGLPCYQLWGGKCRPAVPVYSHSGGDTFAAAAKSARELMDEGFRYVRCQLGGYAGTESYLGKDEQAAFPGVYFEPREKLRRLPEFFAHLRRELGDEVELLYDVHERLAPIDAVWLAKELEPYRLFFLEDVFAPEDMEWLEILRRQSAVPIAIGELFNNPQEFVPYISRRLFDFVRVHPSQIGGVTPCLKLAHLCEPFGIRTAWHGPGDVSPVGMTAAIHMDLATHNFGIQEWAKRLPIEQEIFPGLPELRNGMVFVNEKPGWGLEFDEERAAAYLCDPKDVIWTSARLRDGTIARP